MVDPNFHTNGLTEEEVRISRQKHGSNKLISKSPNKVVEAILGLAKEPMILFLLAASVIYFVSGDTGDGLFLSSAVILVAVISLLQESRSRNALKNLSDFSKPHCKVIRNGSLGEIKSEDLVIGDSLMVEEGTLIAADGTIIHSNDFSVNQSILTGESMPVLKDAGAEDSEVYSGTSVASGLAILKVTAIGNQTKLGQIGASLQEIKKEKTLLEIQINNFVKKMVLLGSVVFVLVWALQFFKSYDFLASLLKALTLAMSILPEEIPVAFTTFMALGAWQLMKSGVLVKEMKTVESLGSATVICTDKTGTLTENKMSLARTYLLETDQIANPEKGLEPKEQYLIRIAMWASEPIPFDPMEVALHQAYTQSGLPDERKDFKLFHEYPLGGKPPMMTHIFQDGAGNRIVAAKGAPEALMAVSDLSEAEKQNIEAAMQEITGSGFRVLGVGEADPIANGFAGDAFPEEQQSLSFRFLGLVAFYDPPKANIPEVLQDFYQAGIAVKIITGDNALTTATIARQVGFEGPEKSISGEELMLLDDAELEAMVGDTNVFSRMFPEAKLRIVNALKAKGEIVAMTGDGVNDGPALKAAHIGVAMGKRGTEIAKQAASLVLVDDDLARMVDAIAMGRKIYSNLKKAIQYIISIHIPIILTVFLPLAFGWIYPDIFSPVHVIMLELIMGPTCSIVYQNEPAEKNTMLNKPRSATNAFFNWHELNTSIVQGLVITVGVLAMYLFAVDQGYGETLTRSMVFATLVFSNIFLTLINRSFYYSILTTARYKNQLIPLIIGITALILGALIYVPPLAWFFEFEALNVSQLALCMGTGFLFVAWYEVVKWRKRQRKQA